MLKIRTLLIITMVATILVAAVVVTVSAVASSRANQAEQRLETATELSDAAFERIALRSDWLLFHNVRTATQWRKLHQQVTSLLLEARQTFKATPKQSELELLLSDQPAVAEYFEKLEENWKALQSGALDPTAAKRVEDQLVGEMTAKAQEIVAFSTRLVSESRLELSRAVRLGVIMPAILLAVLAILVVADTLVISFSVLRRLAAVREGTDKVAAGNLDFHIDESGRSEVAELAHAFNDMTVSRKRAEDEVRMHRDSLEELVGERTAKLSQALVEVERSNAELQQFAYVASHDLQEPLRMVASYVQLMQERYRGRLDEDADEFIGYAVDGANRMQKLINDLLAYSRVATGEKTFVATDATSAMGIARANLDFLIEESRAVVTNDALPTVLADETRLALLFQNLIANSIKFRGEEPPRVHVSARQEGDEGVFSVRDNGIGFEQEQSERIFTIFQRLNPRSEYGGTGIGLAISKSIVERHGGRIWVESVPGEGSTFYFTVPLTRGGAT